MFLFTKKKVIIPLGVVIFVLILGAGGFFYWQNQKDVRELNKTLPKGVKVEKSLIGNEYRVINKIDGYEFKVPKEWRGVKEIKYIPQAEGEKYIVNSINLKGLEGSGKNVAIDRFKIEEKVSLKSLAEKIFNDFGLIGELNQDKLEQFEIIKTQENVHLGGEFVYFFKQNFVVYVITGGSEEFIREIISNGKW